MDERTAQEWCEVISDALMEEDFEIMRKDVQRDRCVLDVEEKRSPRRKALLSVHDDGSIEVIDVAGGAPLVQAALDRRGVGKLVSESRELDFEDEDHVRLDMSRTLDVPFDDLLIDSSSLESFRIGTVWEVSTGRKEWVIARDDDQVRDLAIAVVEQDFEENPEIFNRSFVAQHIDEGRLRRELRPDVVNMRMEDLEDMRPDDFWDEYEGEGLEAPEEDEEGERRDPEPSEIEELAEKQADRQLEDPMAYLEDIYGEEEAVTQALRIVPVDAHEIAEEAVSADGEGHYLSHYDGEIRDTASGFKYWRQN